jgi:PAS domain S-box-containing protein
LNTEQELHILLVDDDEDDALIIHGLLEDIQRITLVFNWAPTYEQGSEMIRHNQWSAVLVDYDLGVKNGLELIREAVAREVRVPMIMVTGRGRYEIDVEAMRAGATDYVSKDQLNSSFLERTIRYALERRRVEEELEQRVQERTREIQLLLDQTPAMLWSTNPDLKITSIRGKSLSSLNLTAHELLGKTLQTAFPGLSQETEEKIITAHERALLGLSMKYEIEYGRVSLSAYVEPFYDQEMGIVGCIGTAFDITERKQAEIARQTSLALFEGLFEAGPDAILLVLEDGTIQRANRQAASVFGYTRQELEGKRVEQLIPNRFRGEHVRHRSDYNHNPRRRPMGIGLNLFGQHKDSHEFPVDVTLSSLSVNQQTYVICVVRDLSERGKVLDRHP